MCIRDSIYPARTRWLKAQLQLDDLPSPDCAEYRNWFADINPHSTVLVLSLIHI